MFTDPSGQSWQSFWDKIGNWFNDTFGFVLYTENSSMIVYRGIFEMRSGTGFGKQNNKPVIFYISRPSKWWKIDQYSFGFKFTDSIGTGFKLFSGSTAGFGWYNKDHGTTISLSILGRIGIRESTNTGHGLYKFDQLSINLPEITIIVGLIIYGIESFSGQFEPHLPDVGPVFI